jgi:hypothetical protein
MSELMPHDVSLMRYQEFAESPESVIDQVDFTGNPVIITSNGRFMFLIERATDTGAPISENGKS